MRASPRGGEAYHRSAAGRWEIEPPARWRSAARHGAPGAGSGGSVWRAEELTVDLKGAKSGSFEFHNDSTDGVLRIRSFTITALPSDSR